MGSFNDALHLERAVHSILEQSFRDFEFIAVDDGSDDGSAQILDRLADGDARIRVLHQQNTGLTCALVRGCELARGEFIARQDSDDWSHPERLAEQVALLESDPRIGFVSCATQFVGPEQEPLVVMDRPRDPEEATRGLLERREGPPAHGSVVFRASTYRQVGGYRPEFLFSQDSDLWLRLGEVSMIGYVPAVRYFHRKDIESTSGAHREAQSRFAELAHACRHARLRGLDEAPLLWQAAALSTDLRSRRSGGPRNRQGAVALTYLLGSQLVVNRDARARRYLWQVLRAQPWHWKAWVRLLQSYSPAGRNS
jgi:glycosyltransferase involved in cell wall biosynthesis